MNEHNKMQHLKAIEKDGVIKEMYEKGLKYKEISLEIGFSIRRIQKAVKRLGLSRFDRNSTIDYKKKMCKLREDGLLIAEIAEILGKEPGTIREHLKKMGFNCYDRATIRDTEFSYILKLYNEGFTNKEIIENTGYSITKIKKCLNERGLKENLKCCSCGVKIISKRMCLTCKNQKAKERNKKNYYKKPKSIGELMKQKHINVGSNSGRRGLKYNLKESYLNHLREKQEGICAITKDKLILNSNNARSKISLDRFDNSKGYVEGNVMFVSYWLNARKGDMSLEELKEYMPIVYERGKKFLESL